MFVYVGIRTRTLPNVRSYKLNSDCVQFDETHRCKIALRDMGVAMD